MRLWLKDSERRPDPAPVRTDDRGPMLVGLVLWVIALIVILVFREPLAHSNNGWMLWTCVAGVALGLVALVYSQRRHRRS